MAAVAEANPRALSNAVPDDAVVAADLFAEIPGLLNADTDYTYVDSFHTLAMDALRRAIVAGAYSRESLRDCIERVGALAACAEYSRTEAAHIVSCLRRLSAGLTTPHVAAAALAAAIHARHVKMNAEVRAKELAEAQATELGPLLERA